LVSFPIQLEEVQIVAVTCPQRPDRKQALGLLRQVRMSLLANVVARAQSSATMQRLLFERRFEGSSGRVASQTVRKRVTSSTAEAFSAARSAAAFSRQGFIEDSTGAHTYIGPDAETLIDDAFAERYCFKVAPPDRTRPLQVGLGFEPVDREDGRIDIVGTVWVDTLSRVLRDMDFHYLGLDPQTSALSPEGKLSFRELSNGVVIIDQWSLRLGTERRQAGRTLVGRTAEVTSMSGGGRERPQEIGGEIARASWPDGYSWQAPLGTIRLRVVDGQGQPASGSVVRLLDTDYQATTDASGSFLLTDLLPGPYTASVRDPRLAALDVPSTTTLRLSAVRDSTVDGRIVVESADDYVIKRCGYGAGVIAGRGRLLGRVMRADGQPAADARWTMRDEFGTVMVESGRVDAEGFFNACQLPMNKSVTIDVWQGDRRTNASAKTTDPLTTLRLVLPQ
ncbi:MAG TPA: carboxypeptidase-like regulatory domain-containing protein, partial [Gemmatimonadaceae bacterium]